VAKISQYFGITAEGIFLSPFLLTKISIPGMVAGLPMQETEVFQDFSKRWEAFPKLLGQTAGP
jgi:hypothetical protein